MSSPLMREKKAFRGGHESLKLEVVGPQDNPTSKGKPDIKEKGADEESEHVRGRSLHGQNEDIVSFEEAKIAKNSKPDQQIPSSKHQTANIPHVPHYRPGLYEALDDRPHDDKAVICADHHVPEVQELHSLTKSESPVIVPCQEHSSLMFQQLRPQQSPQAQQERAHAQDNHHKVQHHYKLRVWGSEFSLGRTVKPYRYHVKVKWDLPIMVLIIKENVNFELEAVWLRDRS